MTSNAQFAPRPRRSLMFVPAVRLDRYPKAVACGPDMVAVDLEDSVPPDRKDAAREEALKLAAQEAGGGDGIERLIRVNAIETPDGEKDIQAIQDMAAPPAGLIIPKARAAGDIHVLDKLLSGNCAAVRLHVIIETNDGLEACYDIAKASDRVASLVFGGFDMAADLRVKAGWAALLYARQRIVHAAAGAAIDVIDMPNFDLDDAAGLEAEAAAAAEIGFTGKIAIHPKQVGTINRAFSADAGEVEKAREIIAAFDAGKGRLLVVDGRVIEEPVVKSMRRIVAVADRIAGA